MTGGCSCSPDILKILRGLRMPQKRVSKILLLIQVRHHLFPSLSIELNSSPSISTKVTGSAGEIRKTTQDTP